MQAWHSIYCRSSDQASAAAAAREVVTALGYTLYDPFVTLSLKAYPVTVKLFVSPSSEGWVRITGEFDEAVTQALSRQLELLDVLISEEAAHINVWTDGTEKTELDALIPYLRADRTRDDLIRALQATAAPVSEGLPADALPEDIRRMAGGVDLKQADKMFARMAATLSGKAGADPATDARARELLRGDSALWGSVQAARVQAIIACLTLPADWRTPDFVSLRDAYALHRRLQRSPNAILLPGDRETMDAVPNALEYVPIYGGQA